MELSQRVDELEAELKIVKNEVQTVLLDIRERVLSYYDNPFQVIEAKAGGRKGDVDASIVGGGSDSRPAPAAAPAVAPAAVEQRPPDLAMGGDFGEGARKMEQSSNQLKALADQMQLERQAMEQERRALDQSRQAAAQAAQTPMSPMGAPGQFGAAAPGQFGAGMPVQFGQGMPGQFGPAMQSMPGYGPAQPMMQQPMMQPMQQSMQGPVQGPMQGSTQGPVQGVMQGPQAMQGAEPVHHKHIHQKDRADDYDEEEGLDDRGSYTSQRTRESRGSSSGGGQGMRPSRRTPVGRDSDRGDEGRRPARRVISGKRRPWEGWDTEEESAGDHTEVNLMTLIGLVRWVEKSIQKLGKDKVEAIVEIYQTAGYLPSSYKDTIPQIIRLADDEKPEGVVTMGDSISVLLQLDSLLGGKFQTESAVLSTLFGEDGGYPWTKQ